MPKANFTTEGLAILFPPDEKLNVEKVVLAKCALDVVNHSFGAATKQVAKLRLVLIVRGEILEISTLTTLKLQTSIKPYKLSRVLWVASRC